MSPEYDTIFTPRDVSLRAQTLQHAQEEADAQRQVPQKGNPIGTSRQKPDTSHVLEQQRVAHQKEAHQALAQQQALHQQQASQLIQAF